MLDERLGNRVAENVNRCTVRRRKEIDEAATRARRGGTTPLRPGVAEGRALDEMRGAADGIVSEDGWRRAGAPWVGGSGEVDRVPFRAHGFTERRGLEGCLSGNLTRNRNVRRRVRIGIEREEKASAAFGGRGRATTVPVVDDDCVGKDHPATHDQRRAGEGERAVRTVGTVERHDFAGPAGLRIDHRDAGSGVHVPKERGTRRRGDGDHAERDDDCGRSECVRAAFHRGAPSIGRRFPSRQSAGAGRPDSASSLAIRGDVPAPVELTA